MVKDTSENLRTGMDGEAYEFESMYPGFLALAEKENIPPLIKSFKYALEAEKGHWALYKKALEAVTQGKDLPAKKTWVCEISGHTHEGDEAPDECPICKANKKAYTEVK